MRMWRPFTLAKKVIPRVVVGNLVYQDGVPNTPVQDLVGGGNVPLRNPPAGKEQPVIMAQTINIVGIQGMIPLSPFELTPLGLSPEIPLPVESDTTDDSSM